MAVAEILTALRRWFNSLREEFSAFVPLALAIVVGIGAGVLTIVANNASSKWAVVMVAAAAGVPLALLFRDIRKLLLVVLVVDIPLGIDIAIQDQEWHQGGPTGYMVSLMTVALVLGYALWILDRRPKPRFFPSITVPALLYLLMVIVSLFQSRHLQLSLFGVFFHLQFILMYLYLANHVRTWDDVRLVVLTTVSCLLFEGVLMTLQYFMSTSLNLGVFVSYAYDSSASAGATGPRVGGTIGTANSAAAYVAPMLTLTLGAYLARLIDKKLAFPALSFGAVALVATASRTAWGSVVLALAVLFSQLFRSGAGKKALGLVLAGALAVGILFGSQVVERLAAASTDTTRPELATMARNIIAAYPLGIGENNYDQVMSDRYAHPAWVGHTHVPVHNKYLLVWAETGLQGLLAFVLLLVAPIWLARRWLFRTTIPSRLRILAASFLGMLAGYAFHMNTEGFSSRANVQIFWFVLAMSAAINQLIIQEGRMPASPLPLEEA